MSEQNQTVTLQLTKAMLDSVQTNYELINLPAVRANWVDKYNLVTGTNGGESAYEAEKILFMQKLTDSKDLQACDKFTLYAAWTLHGVSGLTFRDDQAYIVAYKGKATWMPGWKGRLEQIQQRENVHSVTEPQIVYDCDLFDWERGESGVKINSHKPKFPRPDGSEIIYVYLTIWYKDGTKQSFLMDRDEVHAVRDKYSAAHKYYVNNGGKYANGNPIDPPLSISNPAQYWRKTLVKRVYNNTPKNSTQRFIDDKIAESIQVAPQLEDIDESIKISKIESAFDLVSGEHYDPNTAEVVKTEDVNHTNVPSLVNDGTRNVGNYQYVIGQSNNSQVITSELSEVLGNPNDSF